MCQRVRKKHGNNIYGGGVGMEALQSQPWKPLNAYVRCPTDAFAYF